jgi:hypothetical protein
MPAEAATMVKDKRHATLWQTAKAVLSAFIGIRRTNEHGAVSLSPGRVIIVGIACAAIFVVTLIALVRWVVS